MDLSSIEYTNQGGPGNDRLRGGAGEDVLLGGKGDDRLRGEAGNDSLDGGHGDDTLDGGDGDDVLHGGHGNDSVKGGSGSDSFVYASGHDRYVDGAGERDVVRVSEHFASRQAVVVRRGSDPKDLRIGFNEANSVTLAGQFTARDAFEEVVFEADGAAIDLRTLSVTTLGSEGDDVLSGIKRGASSDDRFYGLAGNDRITGGAGADWLSGGPGRDRLDGGVGADTYFYAIGDGEDTIVDGGGRDVIEFSEGVEADDLMLIEDGRNLVIGFASNASDRLILSHQLGAPSRRIETLQFADGSVRNLYE